MKYIIIPEREKAFQLPFFFAVEEYVARTYKDDDYFMVWRVEPTVMLGSIAAKVVAVASMPT